MKLTFGVLRRARAALAGREAGPKLPRIVCLCGSTRFMEQFFNSGWDETMKGHIVLSVGVNLKLETPDGGHVGEAMGPEVKEMLDELHKRKIDLADEVFVLNVGGYIGESMRSEIAYAEAHRKPVRYLEPLNGLEAENPEACDGCGEVNGQCPLCCGHDYVPGSEECETCNYVDECACQGTIAGLDI